MSCKLQIGTKSNYFLWLPVDCRRSFFYFSPHSVIFIFNLSLTEQNNGNSQIIIDSMNCIQFFLNVERRDRETKKLSTTARIAYNFLKCRGAIEKLPSSKRTPFRVKCSNFPNTCPKSCRDSLWRVMSRFLKVMDKEDFRVMEGSYWWNWMVLTL